MLLDKISLTGIVPKDGVHSLGNNWFAEIFEERDDLYVYDVHHSHL